MKSAALAAVLMLWACQGWAAVDAALTEKQAQARQQQDELRTRIRQLQKRIERQEASRRDASLALKKSETAISDIGLQLAGLAEQTAQADRDLKALDARTQQQAGHLQQRRNELAQQLRAQYVSGLSPWTALLSGDDPRLIGRDLSYLGYVSTAQAQAVRDVNAAIADLQVLHEQTQAKKTELDRLAEQTAARQAELMAQKTERENVLRKIDADLRDQRGQAQNLADNEARLGRLITDLEAEIARQAEQARLAEEKRLAEARRRAEEARQAAQEQQRILEREREKVRLAEQAARETREQAERERLEREATQARLQVERARASARDAERVAKARQQAVVPAQTGAAGPMAGLSKQLPRPVSGAIQGRFGAERPEGGVWRGVVMRAPEGSPVRAVAAGRVAFASWLNGFGNIIIVDHGNQYLSVYAYNQGLLKDVGDPIEAGAVIATVGSTGGQVESGLYFEIRHQGKPVNPLLWLAP